VLTPSARQVRVSKHAGRTLSVEVIFHRGSVCIEALRGKLLLAEVTLATCCLEGNHHAIAWLDVADGTANFIHDAGKLMAENVASC
jgi:hypothetical protein